MQETSGDELSTSTSSLKELGPTRPAESSTDQQPLPQSGHAAVIPHDSPVSMPSTHKVPSASASLPPATGVNLNALMEDLDRNMTQQGVSTVPKGHCSACAKPIVGQVTCNLPVLCIVAFMLDTACEFVIVILFMISCLVLNYSVFADYFISV